MSNLSRHVVIGLSGGVDSAVAALLLKEQGHRVTALFMKNWEEDDDADYCAAEQDLKEARAVCEHLDIPLHTVNFASEYWERVFEYFLAELRAGRTPNPDVLCNREIKFKVFLDHARKLGADRIATGHYARLSLNGDAWQLRKARDADKDQSYFLHAVDQAALSLTWFPLGEITKSEVRARAKAAGLPNYARKDSTGICFIGERKFKDFLARFLPAQPGDIRRADGGLLGRHQGLMYYTLGQRQGLGIGGPGSAWYVIGKDLGRNTLWVEQGQDHPALYSSTLRASEVHWIGPAPTLPHRCQAKTRYRQADQACRVEALDGGRLQVSFDAPQRAVTPGQSVVFYDGDVCLGGAVIEWTDAPTPIGAEEPALSVRAKSH